MANPGGFTPGAGEDWIGRKFAEYDQKFRELAAANVFGRTGIVPKDGGTDLDGFVNVNGPMTVTGEANVNGPLEVNGSSVFNGALAIMGALTLQPGIIQNDALANPLTTGSAGFTASNQSFNTASTNYGTQTIAIPAGFTNALVMNGVSAGGTNSGAGGDYLYVAADIDGTKGGEIPTYAAASFYASASAFAVRTLTGLAPGATISVSARVRTSSGTWAASGANIVNINALVLFYR